MGATASTPPKKRTFKSRSEALSAGYTGEQVDTWLREHPTVSESDGAEVAAGAATALSALWREHVPPTAKAAVTAQSLRIGAPTTGSRDDALRPVLRKAAALYAMHNEAELKELLAMLKSRQSQVVVKPYSEPEDMAESIANDYAQDLFNFYVSSVRECENALAAVRTEQSTQAPPRFDTTAIERARADIAAARLAQAEAEAAAAARAVAAAAREKDNEERRRRWIAEVKTDGGAGGGMMARKLLNQSIDAGWPSIEDAALAMLHALLDLSVSPDPTRFGEAVDEAASRCQASAGSADLLWRLVTPVKGAEPRVRPSLLRTLADKLTEPGAAQLFGRTNGRGSHGDIWPLLCEASYLGNRQVVDALLDSYERRAAASASARPISLMKLTVSQGLNPLHLAAKAFGEARNNILHICGRLARHLDPNTQSGEKRDFWSYAESCQNAKTVEALRVAVETTRAE